MNLTTRPVTLISLFASLTSLPGVGEKMQNNFARLGIRKPIDLISHTPVNGVKRNLIKTVAGMTDSDLITVCVTVLSHQTPRLRGPYKVVVRDSEVVFTLVFFHTRLDWLKKILPLNEKRIISGRIEKFGNNLQITHPDHIIKEKNYKDLPKFEPIYPLTQGVTQKLIFNTIKHAISQLPCIDEWIEPEFLAKKKWPAFKEAVESVHRPLDESGLLPNFVSKERLAYDEFLAHQVTLAIHREKFRKLEGFSSESEGILQQKVEKLLEFDLTDAQKRVIGEITSDIRSSFRMNRLLQGDVGSGKTLVAFFSILSVVEAGGQAALMAPTEVLIKQHFSYFAPYCKTLDIKIVTLTGSDSGKTRAKKLESIGSGEYNIVLGTHALFQSEVVYSNLRLAIIDEQHRFGVKQRLDLVEKGKFVDLLVMTATPIPRSLSLAKFGDIEYSVIDQKPAGRKPIKTAVISEKRIPHIISRLEIAISKGEKVFWICPLIAESETFTFMAAEKRFEILKSRIPNIRIGLIHGQMSFKEKESVMELFLNGTIKLLVSTTVIEVGIDVKDASIIIIEGAENFGLAQLHQLRGRIGRGKEHSSCVLLHKTSLSQNSRKRLEILKKSQDGFEIAEQDLLLRGSGEALGQQQSGMPNFKFGNLVDHAALLEHAHLDANKIVAQDPELLTKKGNTIRFLLYLMKQDLAFKYLKVG